MVSLRAFHSTLWKILEMALKTDDVRNIANLARLQIDDSDAEQYVTEMSSVLALFEQMNQQDTTGITPMAHPMDATQRLRPDEVTESNQREQFQSVAPDVADGLYRVPRVVE